MEVRDFAGRLEQRRAERREHLDRVGDVLLRGAAFVADEPAVLEEHAIGHAQLAEVVDACGLRELRALDLREPHPAADRLGEKCDAAAVIAGARIAQIDDLHQRIERRALDGEDRFGQRLLIGVGGAGLGHRIEARAAQRDQVARERDERHRIDRFVQEGRRAALECLAL